MSATLLVHIDLSLELSMALFDDLKMKILLISMFIAIFPIHFSNAGMTAKFLPLNKVVLIMADNMAGQANTDDPKILYRDLNVPEQQSSSGTGKKIQLENKNVNLVCAIKKTGENSCNLYMSFNDHAQIVPAKKMFQYQVSGAAANEAHKLFHTDANDQYNFVSENGRLKITSTIDLFIIKYQE